MPPESKAPSPLAALPATVRGSARSIGANYVVALAMDAPVRPPLRRAPVLTPMQPGPPQKWTLVSVALHILLAPLAIAFLIAASLAAGPREAFKSLTGRK